jgi:Uma2 family endonuclease
MIPMSTVPNPKPISVEDYLAGEQTSDVRHEYVAGVVYAMVGGTNAHSQIASNALVSLGTQLRGTPCRAFNPDTKIRIQFSSHTRFYYPDVSVICRPNPQQDTFQDDPSVVIEVLSDSTRRADEGEKKDAYLTIPKLTAYILLEQTSATATCFRRGEQGFQAEFYTGTDAVIELPTIDAVLRLDEVYDGIELADVE